MKKNPWPLNQRGQFAIEMVLLIVFSTVLFTALMKNFKEKQIMENILTKPWEKVAGMIENGTWGDAKSTRTSHPNNPESVATLQQLNL